MEPYAIDSLPELKGKQKAAPVTALSNGVSALELPFAPEDNPSPTGRE